MKLRNKFNKDKLFFTSDPHFGHTNIIKYCNRPYENAKEMNESLIENWNRVVPEDGVVFCLGDFAMNTSTKQTQDILDKILQAPEEVKVDKAKEAEAEAIAVSSENRRERQERPKPQTHRFPQAQKDEEALSLVKKFNSFNGKTPDFLTSKGILANE